MLSVPNLFMVETIHSAKLATQLHAIWSKLKDDSNKKLNVFIQVSSIKIESLHAKSKIYALF